MTLFFKKEKKEKKSKLKQLFTFAKKLKNLLLDPKYRIVYLIFLCLLYIIFWRVGILRAEDLKDPEEYHAIGRWNRHKDVWMIKPNALTAYSRSMYKDAPIPEITPDPGYGTTVFLIGIVFSLGAIIYDYFANDNE